jgi:hypothetical protein
MTVQLAPLFGNVPFDRVDLKAYEDPAAPIGASWDDPDFLLEKISGTEVYTPPITGSINFEKFVKPVIEIPVGGEGKTPGYWKNHHEDWVGYNPNASYNDVFGVTVEVNNKNDSDKNGVVTLHEAVSAKGGGQNAYLRHSVAALLNITHPNVAYEYSLGELFTMTQNAFAWGDFEYRKDLLEDQNELEANMSDPAPDPIMFMGPMFEADLNEGYTLVPYPYDSVTPDDLGIVGNPNIPEIPVGETAQYVFWAENETNTSFTPEQITITDPLLETIELLAGAGTDPLIVGGDLLTLGDLGDEPNSLFDPGEIWAWVAESEVPLDDLGEPPLIANIGTFTVTDGIETLIYQDTANYLAVMMPEPTV